MNNNKLQIRTEIPSDYPKVYNTNFAAFNRSDEAQLVDRLRGGNTFIKELSLVACINDNVVGHILFTTIDILSENKSHSSLALAPMAVHPDYQKQEIGSQLVKAGLAKAKSLGYDSVIVLGHEAFYPRFQFLPASKWNIRPPFNIPEKSFMALELKDGALENVSGVVEYPKEFQI